MKIINLTQHAESAEQKLAGVVSTVSGHRKLVEYLTFTSLPEMVEINKRCAGLVRIATMMSAEAAMIGGAPYLMAPLTAALKEAGIKPLFAFSERVSQEDPDTGVKTSVFKHLGFVEG
jgi:hypothetical protein